MIEGKVKEQKVFEMCGANAEAVEAGNTQCASVGFGAGGAFSIWKLPPPCLTLEPTLRDVLMEEFAEDELPTNTYYGDGSPIGASQLESLRNAYMQELISFPWQKGDVLLLDNMLAAHGRAPYKGQREVLIVMAEATSRDACL